MKYFFKCLIMGAGNLQFFPVTPFNHIEFVERTHKIIENRAGNENISRDTAMNKTIREKYIGLFLMFAFVLSCLVSTIFLAMNDYDWKVSVLPIVMVYVVHLLIVLKSRKIVDEELRM